MSRKCTSRKNEWVLCEGGRKCSYFGRSKISLCSFKNKENGRVWSQVRLPKHSTFRSRSSWVPPSPGEVCIKPTVNISDAREGHQGHGNQSKTWAEFSVPSASAFPSLYCVRRETLNDWRQFTVARLRAFRKLRRRRLILGSIPKEPEQISICRQMRNRTMKIPHIPY